jgi:subtilisin-like proprotein convertase family protein
MKSRLWSVISLLCFLAAIGCWLLGNQRQRQQTAPPPTNAPAHTSASRGPKSPTTPVRLLTQAVPASSATAREPFASALAVAPDPTFPLRVRNTARPLAEFSRSESAILLRNALIDTAAGAAGTVPPHLRAGESPGAYLVQTRGPADAGRLTALSGAGAWLVSYIPNNTWLVRMPANAARRLQDATWVNAVLPYEPYYKLEPQLLPLAVEQRPLPEGEWLTVTAFPDAADTVRAVLEAQGATIKGEGRMPFGPQYVVEPAPASLVALAALPEVQLLERFARRVPMNDLTRVRLGVSEGPLATNLNYFNLSGTNGWVNINDTGVDAEHPDLKGRVFGETNAIAGDAVGHGTHVAGTIASSGLNGPNGTNAPGSVEGASFRGLAPAAKLVVLPVDLILGPPISDAYLQETAARTNYVVLQRTNAMISNNSWNYGARSDYDSAAASYDAATRDALPDLSDVTNAQAMLYVFAAGNYGLGNDAGSAGEPGSVSSPGTAKNVITVGALESPRFFYYTNVTEETITNIIDDEFVVTNVTVTNLVHLGETDSADQVAAYSSRGNVGIGLEGADGRFKPDLVAPGAMLVSTRPLRPAEVWTNWDPTVNITNASVSLFPAQVVAVDDTNQYSLYVPADATRLTIEVLPNLQSPAPFPTFPLYVNPGAFIYGTTPYLTNRLVLPNAQFPALSEGDWFYGVGNPTGSSAAFNLRTILEFRNDLGAFSNTIKQADAALKPYYRFQSGTSGSAAAVSGLLALVQEFFEQQLKTNYSPALLKAMLINGARSLGMPYDFWVRNQINYQGWGLASLPTTLPGALTNALDKPDQWPLALVDQSATNALASGQTNRYTLSLNAGSTNDDLRVTLVWTDPPGNPAASYKLVNDLDLIVSNQANGLVYVGNNIAASSDYNQASALTNLAAFDNVNNVENVYLRGPLATNYTVLVAARRVNVNAVHAHTNGIVQDYALVVSINGTNAITFKPEPQAATNAIASAELTIVTNGVPLLQQRVGANSPLQLYPLGVSNQWHFYAFTNAFVLDFDVLGETNFGSNVAFVTFMPPELSRPRNEEADIDLYVTRSQDPRGSIYQAQSLLTLNSNALQFAYRSVAAGGSETIVFTNAADREIFYIGVKAEDQEAAEYGFFAISSKEPFGTIDEEGNHHLRGLRLPQLVPDGTPAAPGATNIFAIGVYPIDIVEVVVSNEVYAQDLGDLLGNLSHQRKFVVLNNHKSSDAAVDGFYRALYDDSGSGEFPTSVTTDGPGTLDSFVGSNGAGAWILWMVDNALGHTSLVQSLSIRLTPNLDLLRGAFVTIKPHAWRYAYIDVPPDVSRMIVSVSRLSMGPLELYLRRAFRPTRLAYDNRAILYPPGGELSRSIYDDPPLVPDRYFVGLYNPNANSVSCYIYVRFERDLPDVFRRTVVSTNLESLGDLVLTVGTNDVPSGMTVSSIRVGIRLDQPRASDLALRLVSPRGASVLLSENRGGTNWARLGAETVTTNFHHVAVTYHEPDRLAALYLDGVKVQEKACLDLADRLATRWDFYLGANLAETNQYDQYRGLLDEMDVYDRALAASEILAIYKWGGAGKPTNGLVSRWPFDDATGSDWLTNNPAFYSNVTAVAPGKFGPALHFPTNGTGFAFVPRSFSLDVGAGSGFTLDAWISPADLASNRAIALWADGTNRTGVEFYLRPGSDTNLPPGELAARFVDALGVTNHVATDPKLQGLIHTNFLLTNLVYATFTDDTNLAHLPIKFTGLTNLNTQTIPGFLGPAAGATNLFTNQLISGFEWAPADPTRTYCALPSGVYPPTVIPESTNAWARTNGWAVVNGCVTVIQAPCLAHTGTNLLALREGRILRWVPTEPGREYRLQFAHRRQPLPPDIVAWWPGQTNTVDIVGGHDATLQGTLLYTNAMVDAGFLFVTNSGYLTVPDHEALLATNEWSIELWFSLTNQLALTNPVTLGGPMVLKASGSTNANVADVPVNYGLGLSPAGLELGFNDPTVQGDPDSQDAAFELVRSSQVPTEGTFHHVAGTFRQVSSNRVELKLYVDGLLDRHVTLPGALSNAVVRTDPLNVPLLLGTNALGGLNGFGRDTFGGILDEISLYQRALSAQEIAEIHALYDVGKLQPPVHPRTHLIVGDAIDSVFTTDADRWQTNAVTFVATTAETLLDLEALDPGLLLDSVEILPLEPRYFLPEESLAPFIGQSAAGDWRLEIVDTRLGITNAIPPNLVSWQLQFTFAPPAYRLVVLTNGVPYTNTIPHNATRYFQVQVPPTAVQATNTLLASNNLSLWHNPASLPAGVPAYGDLQFLTNQVDGRAVLATNGWWLTQPDGTPLTSVFDTAQLVPGEVYYLGVKNDGPSLTAFSLQVDFFPDASRDICPDLRPLPWGQTIITNILATNTLQFFCYQVTEAAKCAFFQLEPIDGNVDLYLRNSRSAPPLQPAPDWYEYAGENPGLRPEVIVVNQRSQTPLFPGSWYLGVLNRETNTVQYRLRVVEQTNYFDLPLLLDVPVTDTAVAGNDTCTYFVLSITNPAPRLAFNLSNLSGNARLLTSLNSRPGPWDYLRQADGAARSSAQVLLCTNDLLPDLRGNWYVAVLSREPTNVTFDLTASFPPVAVTTLWGGVAVTNTALANPDDRDCALEYYRFTVVPQATRAEFQLWPLDGNVDLLLRQGGLPTSIFFDFLSAQPDLVPEYLEVTTNTVPVPLTPGDWFVHVRNADVRPVQYVLLAGQYQTNAPVGIYLTPGVTVVGNTITFRWQTYPGLRFHIQYALDLPVSGPIPWQDVPVAITSTSGYYTFTDDGTLTGGPAPFKVFRLLVVP